MFGPGGNSSDEEDFCAEAWDAWPKDACHRADDFGVQWDQPGGDYALAQYRFMQQPQQGAESANDAPSSFSFMNSSTGADATDGAVTVASSGFDFMSTASAAADTNVAAGQEAPPSAFSFIGSASAEVIHCPLAL